MLIVIAWLPDASWLIELLPVALLRAAQWLIELSPDDLSPGAEQLGAPQLPVGSIALQGQDGQPRSSEPDVPDARDVLSQKTVQQSAFLMSPQFLAATVCDLREFVRCDIQTVRCRPCDEAPVLMTHLSQ